MRIKPRLPGLSILLAALLAGSPAHATFTSSGHAVFGSDSLTVDSGTGLQWLDVNLSLNRSFDDVSTEFGPGGDLAGFRYATQADMFTLFENAGFGMFGGSNVDFAAAVAFQGFFGVTALGTNQMQTNGMTGARAANGSLLDGIVVVTDSPGFQNAFAIPNSGNGHTDSFRSSNWGNWLIVATPLVAAPEPASLGLVIAGLAGFAARREPARQLYRRGAGRLPLTQ